MVQIHVFNPLQRIRQLTWGMRWFRRPSRKALQAQPIAQDPALSKAVEFDAPLQAIITCASSDSGKGKGIARDVEFYKDDPDGCFCVFLVEDTLFKVHRCYLLREPSVFADMLKMPQIADSIDGFSDETAVPLSDTAEQFRDLLWALYAPPYQLSLYTAAFQRDPVPLARLLNVAELTIKYSISSYEEWALERIYQFACDPSSFLRTAPPEICARVINVAAQSGHEELLRLAQHRMVSRILWSSSPMDMSAVLEVAEHHGIVRLRGVVYYKRLLQAVAASQDEALLSISDERARQRMVRARESLSAVVAGLSKNVPRIEGCCCPSRDECARVWAKSWEDAHEQVSQLQRDSDADKRRHDDVDVLGRLKAVMIYLRGRIPMEDGIDVACTLAALEAIAVERDRVVDGLVNHFCTVD